MGRRSPCRSSARSGHARSGNRGGLGLRIGYGISPAYQRRLRIEPLEDRSLLSAVSWDGGGNGTSWSDPLNWSGNVLPTTNDDVTINAPGAVAVTLIGNSRTLHTLTVGSDDQLTVTSSGALSVTAACSITGTLAVSGRITLNGESTIATLNLSAPIGSIDGAGNITITNAMSWSSGQFDGTGVIRIDQNATLAISANDLNTAHNLNKRTLQNDGVTTWTSGVLNISNGATFVNNGEFYANGAGQSALVCNGQQGQFINSGLFKNLGTSSVPVGGGLGGVKFDNRGELDGGTGGIELNAGGNQGPGSSFANVTLEGTDSNFIFATAGASVYLAGALFLNSQITVNANTTFNGPGTLSFLGTLKGTGDVTFESNVLWLGGGMSGSGKTIIPSGATFILQCGNGLSQSNNLGTSLSRTLENDGAINWTTGTLYFVAGMLDNRGEITIHGGVGGYSVGAGNTIANHGVITIKGSQSIDYWNWNNTDPELTIDNCGSMVVDGPAFNFNSATQLNNSGSIDIQAGSLTVNGAMINTDNGLTIGNASGALNVKGNLLGDSTNVGLIGMLAAVTLNGAGTAAAPQLLEAQSRDFGPVTSGFSHNFAFNTLALAGTTYVKLVDQSDNAAAAEPECVYVDTLIIPAGATLDLNGLHLYARATQIAGTVLNGQVTTTPPAVADVMVASSAWSPAFYDQLRSAGLGDGGYAIPGNAVDQLAPLPWSNLDQIKIAFNEDVNVQAGSLSILGATSGLTTPIDFEYDATTHIATWTLAQPVSTDTLTLSLASTGPAAVTDGHGVTLDGEWPGATDDYPSGDGTAGGDFHFAFNVLPGDVSHDGIVDIQDITNVANHWLQGSPLSDGNGDGVVDIQEITLIANNWLATNGAAAGGGGSLGNGASINDTQGSAANNPAALTSAIQPADVSSTAVYWDGGGDGVNWSDRFNWDTDNVPGSSSDVTIDVPGAVTVAISSDAQSVHSLTIAADDGLKLTNNGALTVVDTAMIAGSLLISTTTSDNPLHGVALNGASTIGSLTLASGKLTGSGDVIVTGNFDWRFGKVDGAGKLSVSSGATMLIESSLHNLNRNLENDGSASWTGGKVTMQNSTFQNNGSLEVNSSAQCTWDRSDPTSVINNAGSITNIGAGVVSLNCWVNNSGSLVGQGNKIEIHQAATYANNSVFGGAIELDSPSTFTGQSTVLGTLTVANPATVDVPAVFTGAGNVVWKSQLTGAGDLTLDTNATWSASTIDGTGALVIAAGRTFTITANGQITRRLDNYGVVNWTSPGLRTLAVQNFGSFLANSVNRRNISNAGSGATFDNLGSFTNQGAGIVTIDSMTFNNAGTLDGGAAGIEIVTPGVSSDGATYAGVLQFDRAGYTFGAVTNLLGVLTLTDPWSVTTSDTFNGVGALNVISPITLSGAGELTGTATFQLRNTVNSAAPLVWTQPVAVASSVTFNTPAVTLAHLALAGTLSSSGDVTISQDMNWSSGAVNANGSLIVSPGAVLTMSSGTHELHRPLVNNGTVVWTGGQIVTSSPIQNNGEFDATASGTANLSGGAVQTFSNAGTFVQLGSGITQIADSILFDSTGAITVQAGSLWFYGTANFNQSINVPAGADIGLGVTDNFAPGVMFTGAGGYSYVAGVHAITDSHLALSGGIKLVGGSVTISEPVSADRLQFLGGAVAVNVPLDFPAAVTLGGVVTFNATPTFGGPVLIANQAVFNTPTTIDELVYAGYLGTNGLCANATLTVTGSFDFQAGVLVGSAPIVISPDATMTISTTNDHGIGFGGTLINNGVVTWTGGALYFYNGNLINNNSFVANLNSSQSIQDFHYSSTSVNSVENNGVFTKLGTGALVISGLVSLTNSGIFDVQQGALDLHVEMNLLGGAVFGGSAGSFGNANNLLIQSTDTRQFNGLKNVYFDGAGTAAAPQLIEACSQDLGATDAGFDANFAIPKLSFTSRAKFKLVDQFDNAGGNTPEAVYVDTLSLISGATLDLNGLHLYARFAQVAGTIINGQVTIVPPSVVDVLVASSVWSPAYYDQLQSANLGTGGYAITGDTPEHAETLPWQNVDQIKIAFNEDVVVQSDSLTITGAAIGAIVPAGFSYDSGTHVATWTLAQPIPDDAITLLLASTGPAAVTDRNGLALDGEWPGVGGAFPSGDGVAGGDMQINFGLLGGDLTRDGVVDIQDVTMAANHWLQASPGVDGNGDGVVDIQDITLIANNWLKQRAS